MWLSLLGLALLSPGLYAQQKYEKERKIKVSDVPEQAKRFLKVAQVEEKIRWYFEENLLGNSIEAKFKRSKKRYSIEFGTDGYIQDIEIQIAWKEVPIATGRSIQATLDSMYSYSRIDKIQLQFTGEEVALQQLMRGEETPGDYSRQFEVVVEGKVKQQVKLYEILFDERGRPITVATIVQRNTDHLEY